MSSNRSQNNTENDISRAEKSERIKTLMGNLSHNVDNIAKLWIVLTSQNNGTCSDFVTNSYGESWDWLILWKIMSHSPSQKTTSPIKIENAWAFLQPDS